jgi:hypothetical protein
VTGGKVSDSEQRNQPGDEEKGMAALLYVKHEDREEQAAVSRLSKTPVKYRRPIVTATTLATPAETVRKPITAIRGTLKAGTMGFILGYIA